MDVGIRNRRREAQKDLCVLNSCWHVPITTPPSTLCRLTEVINFWMGPTVEANPDGSPATPRTIEEARAAFPDCSFAGTL